MGFSAHHALVVILKEAKLGEAKLRSEKQPMIDPTKFHSGSEAMLLTTKFPSG
jgi:hypothetical protein